MNTSHCCERVKQMEFSDCISTVAVTFSDVLVITGTIGCGFVKRAFGNVFRNFHRWSERLCLLLSSALMSRRCLSLVLYMCQWQKKARSKPPLTGWRQSGCGQSRRTPFKRNDKSSQWEEGEIDLDTHCSEEERLRLSALFLLFEVG